MNNDLIDELLRKTSRTFALAIPLLPEPLRTQVGVGYLLFRIADTLEDAERLDRDERIAQLGDWIGLLDQPTTAGAERLAARWTRQPPSTFDDYNELMRRTPAVLAVFGRLDESAREAITRHAIRSAEGMAETLRTADRGGAFALGAVEQLRHYCYYVAGIVGEMLTELFALSLPASSERERLSEDAAAFGEGLQLVNILKDAPDDARDGRTYLPVGSRAEVMAIAREDLLAAARYADNLQAAGADEGVLAFVTLPRTLAEANLDALASGERKITRAVVTEKLAEAEAIRTGQGA